VSVEPKEGPEALQLQGIQSGAFDIGIGHLSDSHDQIESMLLVREPIVVARSHRPGEQTSVHNHRCSAAHVPWDPGVLLAQFLRA